MRLQDLGQRDRMTVLYNQDIEDYSGTTDFAYGKVEQILFLSDIA